MPPRPPLFSRLSSGDPSAHRPHIKVVLIMWQPPDIIFMIVIIWFLLVPGFPYMCCACFPFSWEGGLMAVGVAPLWIPLPSPPPSSRRTEQQPSPQHPTPWLVGPCPRCTRLRCPAQPYSWHLMTLLPWPCFFPPRGIVRVTQKRTLPRGKPSTPGGGAVPPNWPGNQWPPGRPRPSGAPSVQTLGPRSSPHPRHSAFLNILQEIWACRIQKSLQGAWRPRELWLFPVEHPQSSYSP